MQIEFYFRPDNGFFMNSPEGFLWDPDDVLPPAISNRIHGKQANETGLQRIIHLALDPSGGYFMAWVDKDDECWTNHNVGKSHPDLVEWLLEPRQRADTFHIYIGDGGRFFAKSNLGMIHDNLPDAMVNEINKMGVNNVAGCLMGVHDTFIVLGKGGSSIEWSDNIEEFYPTFKAHVEEMFQQGISYKNLSINPFVADQYFAFWADGTIDYRVSTSLLKDVKDEVECIVKASNNRGTSSDASQARTLALLAASTRQADAQTRRNLESIALLHGETRRTRPDGTVEIIYDPDGII